MRALASLLVSLSLLVAGSLPVVAADLPPPDQLRGWIVEFKKAPRGPFDRLRWFCADGTVHPPKPYPCEPRGGGIQHGELNERAKALRAGGYHIANVLADIDAADYTGPDADLDSLKQMLIERFLIGWDNGWIFRAARSYRGALQSEDEEAGARRLAQAALADPAFRDPSRFYLLRELVRLMPLQGDEESASGVRQLALVIANGDKDFTPLRIKIHNAPDAGDAERVREYARKSGKSSQKANYAKLASGIDSLYAGNGAESAALLAGRVGEPLSSALSQGAASLENADASTRLATGARMLSAIRNGFPDVTDTDVALAALQTSLALETDTYSAGNTLLLEIAGRTRRERLTMLEQTAEALYGVGLLSARHLSGIRTSVQTLEKSATPPLIQYRDELRYLSRVPEWASRWIEFNFEPAVSRLAPLEPEVHLYSQDRLRGSPLLFYSGVIDGLVLDANKLASIEHDLFGRKVGAGLRALNPGMTRGVLRSGEAFRPDGIYLLPETTSDLPPVSGILTQGEGSSLSHVQLLARNLGIPNVVVTDELLPEVKKHTGEPVVLAVSPNGIVELVADGPQWDEIFGAEDEAAAVFVIKPDLEKLDIESTDLIPLTELRATDSGKTSGPKGANLGELKHYFGDTVPNGFVIPFGVFRHLLDQPIETGGPSVFEWMKSEYDVIASKSGAAQEEYAAGFLKRLRGWIVTSDPGPEFRAALRSKLDANFGQDGTYGVFVRSDTNVEDLPGFTGAGLNLTLFNVVGYDNVVSAVREVWASPFTERAYGWRQGNMEDPEYVFPAVVIQLAYPSAKSGVLVTVDVDSGETGWLSVAVNEGVGGAVEGQASESLRIPTKGGRVVFLAQATAPDRSELNPQGGITHVPASGTQTVLTRDEILKLISFTDTVSKFPSLKEENGEVMAADVEFAFKNGQLALLQIRPFVESRRAQGSAYLAGLDAGLAGQAQVTVPLDSPPTAHSGQVQLAGDPR